MAVNVIGQRMNFMVILHGCWLVAILTRRRREAIARLWPNYCLFLTLFLLYQYLLCLGMPPALCIGKPQAEELGVCGRMETLGLFPVHPPDLHSSTPTFLPREPITSSVAHTFSLSHSCFTWSWLKVGFLRAEWCYVRRAADTFRAAASPDSLWQQCPCQACHL